MRKCDSIIGVEGQSLMKMVHFSKKGGTKILYVSIIEVSYNSLNPIPSLIYFSSLDLVHMNQFVLILFILHFHFHFSSFYHNMLPRTTVILYRTQPLNNMLEQRLIIKKIKIICTCHN